MILNYEQIKSKNIIDGIIESEFNDGSYNLTIEKIIDMNNKVSESFTLKPQGMVYVIFKEKLKMPEDIIGFAHVKTSLTKLGIMATNIGIIDPNYNGYISTLLINFGKSEHFISKGDTGLRVTFANMTAPSAKIKLKQNDLTFDNYQKIVQKNITHLDEKFLNLTSVKREVTSYIFKILLGFAILFAAGNFALSLYFSHKNSSEKELDNSIKKYELEISTLSENNKLLQEQLNNYSVKLQVIEDSLGKQSALIQKLKK